MATSAVSLEPQSRALSLAALIRVNTLPGRLLLLLLLSVAAVVVEGYHPYAEDGGLYAAGVERLLDPALFPHWTAFVLAPMRISAFAPTIAAIVRLTHLTFPAVLLLVHFGSVFATLLAGYCIAAQCWRSERARLGAVLLLACWIGLPVAGTSLQIMDPYVTARSFSTPCALLALLAVLRMTAESSMWRRRCWLLVCVTVLGIGSVMHPLMAGYGIAGACLLACFRSASRSVRVAGVTGCAVAALTVAAALQHFAPTETAAYIAAALTRSYWFPSRWACYELVGLAAPLIVVIACSVMTAARRLACWSSSGRMSASDALAGTAVALGAVAIAVAVLFARPDSATHLVARLQPLRAFQTVYIVMILTLGALVGEYALQHRALRWVLAIAVFGAPMFVAERASFPSSHHIQVSRAREQNPWVQSFVWARSHTPKDALFALDPDYIHAPGEDGHTFRAIAERSVLPDYSKDGGEASIAPQLADAWQAGLRAQQSLDAGQRLTDDSGYVSSLRALGVSWVIVRASAPTDLTCPYRNYAAKVCRIA